MYTLLERKCNEISSLEAEAMEIRRALPLCICYQQHKSPQSEKPADKMHAHTPRIDG